MNDINTKLRVEPSINCSGEILNEKLIPELKESNYYVKNFELDGDAPKQFIRAYFYEEGMRIRKKNLNSWPAYIAKTAEKWYPHESVMEYMINKIGQEMGLNMNVTKLVRANGQIRFLSRYFLNKNEILIHGAEICGEHLGDDDMAKEIAQHRVTARELFTIEFISEAIKAVFPLCYESILEDLVKMITFDALVGNNDRHFYNWGVIDTKKKTRKTPLFSPIYDSARGLFWNFSDENIVKLYSTHVQGNGKVIKYLNEACPRISIEDNSSANHFELIEYIKNKSKRYAEIVNEIASDNNQDRVLKMLIGDFHAMFIKERIALIKFVIEYRFEKIRKI